MSDEMNPTMGEENETETPELDENGMPIKKDGEGEEAGAEETEAEGDEAA